MSTRSFLSDNASGAHPKILEAIAAANTGHAGAYGADPWTAALADRIGEHFGPRTRAFPVFNGTGANVASIAAATRTHQAVICAAGAHLDVDECGAPEHIAGIKLLTIAPDHGKLTPSLLDDGVDWTRVGDEHASQPALLSISNATEVGTTYTAAETAALADFAHSRNLLLPIDGARLANAAAHLDTSLAALTTDAGADIVSFGGTKNGLLLGEAVVFCREELAAGFDFTRKQTTQLASKMRFISAQLDALLADGVDWARVGDEHASQPALVSISNSTEVGTTYTPD